MQRFRTSSKLFHYLFANNNTTFLLPSSCGVPSPSKSLFLATTASFSLKGTSDRVPFLIRYMSISTNLSSIDQQEMDETRIQPMELLSSVDDLYGGVVVSMEEPMDSEVFASLLRASLSQWKQKGKKGVWIKLPVELVNLVEPAVKEGFRYHHAEPDYLMLAYWIPETTSALPANASHRVGICAFVMNSNREVLVVQEGSGRFKGSGVWKFPTGVVNEGEDICTAAMREVKEETGIETKFVEVLAFRQSHNSFFGKSDLMFVCMLQPCSSEIQKQDLEIEEAKWMPFEEYADQSFIRTHKMFKYVADICLRKLVGYAGFGPVSTPTTSDKRSYLYLNTRDMY